jgi:hypothetical protein
MTTGEKLKFLKELTATIFLSASERLIAHGIQFKYESASTDDKKGWMIRVIVKEAGYGENTVQELRYVRPANIDAKNMEYHVLTEFLCVLSTDGLSMWHEAAKMINSDKEMQEGIKTEIKNEQKDNFTSDK